MKLEDIYKKVQNLQLPEGVQSQRILSVDIEPVEVGFKILAWQCNMTKIADVDIKLPTVVEIELNQAGVVTKSLLGENYRGSQGSACSRRYLDGILQKRLLGLSLKEDVTMLRDKSMFHCCHIFEIVIAAMMFYRYCSTNLERRNSLYEISQSSKSDEGVSVHDEYRLNDIQYELKGDILFSKDSIVMNDAGEVDEIEYLGFDFRLERNGEQLSHLKNEEAKVIGQSKAAVSIMKMLSSPWKLIAKDLNWGYGLYFTNLMPSSFYGLFMQILTLRRYPGDFAYFQKVVRSLQRGKGVPCCVGMVQNREELIKYYPDFKE